MSYFRCRSVFDGAQCVGVMRYTHKRNIARYLRCDICGSRARSEETIAWFHQPKNAICSIPRKSDELSSAATSQSDFSL